MNTFFLRRFLFLYFLFTAYLLKAQVPEISVPTAAEIDYIRKNIIAKEKNLPDTTVYLPLRPHIIRNAADEGLSLAALNAGIARLNAYFAPANLHFILLPPVYRRLPDLFDFDRLTEESALVGANPEQKVINLYCVNSIRTSDNRQIWAYTYFPSSQRKNLIFARNAAFSQERELARVFAHFLGLFNTSETATGQEKTDRSNCATSGDLLCDTAADPPPGTLTVNPKNCAHNGASVAAPGGGNYTNAPVDNLMSLHAAVCGTQLTAGQHRRLLAGALHRATGLVLPTSAAKTFAPAALRGKNFGTSTTLAWTNLTNNAQGYQIERSTAPDAGFLPIGGVPPQANAFLDTAVKANTTYYYRIRPANSPHPYSEVLRLLPRPAYCPPAYTDSCRLAYIRTFEVPLIGLSDTLLACRETHFKIGNYSHKVLNAETTYSFNLVFSGAAQAVTIWADWNKNGYFEPSESIFSHSGPMPTHFSGTFRLPRQTEGGIFRFRVRSRNAAAGAAENPCLTYKSGDIRDYWFAVKGTENPCLTQGKAILSRIYNKLGGAQWASSANWFSSFPLRNWYGVHTNQYGCIYSLSLPNNRLKGTLPEELFLLHHLTRLNLSGNRIRGAIPKEIAELRVLNTLSLHNNMFSGEIPEALASLRNLTFLELNNNKLTGKVPDKMTQLPLTGLDLKDNLLTALPDFSANKSWDSGSTGLEVARNRLSFDDILPHISVKAFEFDPQNPFNQKDTVAVKHGTSHRIVLQIDEQLTTNQYRWKRNYKPLGDSTTNTLLTDATLAPGLYRYDLTITNPAVPNFSLLPHPFWVRVEATDSTALAALYHSTGGQNWKRRWDLKKPVNTWLGLRFTSEGRVRSINLIDNNLVGKLPEEIAHLTALSDLRLAENALSDTLPEALFTLDKLRFLWLQKNQFHGQISPDFGKLGNLEELMLSENRFSGTLPAEIGKLKKLKILSLHHNQIEGGIPKSFAQLTALTALLLNHNKLTASTPLTAIRSWGFVRFDGLHLAHNHLTFDDILPNIGLKNYHYAPQHPVGRRQQLSIPAGKSYHIKLGIDDTLKTNTYHWFRDDVPLNTTAVNQLEVREMGRYTCQIRNPKAPKLTLDALPVTLYIPSEDSLALVNFFTRMRGEKWHTPWDLSTPIGNWEGVTLNRLGRIIHLSLPKNNLQGKIPESLSTCTYLQTLDLAGNKITALPQNFDKLAQLKILDLSQNNLSGDFPEVLYRLLALEKIYLQKNQLDGKITAALTALKNLRRLDVSDNKLQALDDLSSSPKLGTGTDGKLALAGNYLSFSDLIPNRTIPNIDYVPQQKLGKPTTVSLPLGSHHTVDFSPKNPHPQNRYRWFRNAKPWSKSDKPSAKIGTSGIYGFQIYNPLLPQLLLSAHPLVVEQPLVDSLALLALYESTDGKNWKTPWNLSLPMAQWAGVTLDTSRSVRKLELSAQGLRGEIPQKLSTLPSLEVLDLSHNQLHGTIPDNFAAIEPLVWLDLSHNQLEGAIPESFANLKNLEIFWVNHNKFTKIPVLYPKNPWRKLSEGALRLAHNHFTMEDLLKNAGVKYYTYAPQATIGQAQAVLIYFDNKPFMRFDLDKDVKTNRYRWFKDSAFFKLTDTPVLKLTAPGIYFLEVTNPLLPKITLKSAHTTARRFAGIKSLRAFSDSYRRVDLSWKSDDAQATGFRLERAVANDVPVFRAVADVGANKKSYADTHLADNTAYIYRLRTRRKGGLSFESNRRKASTPIFDFSAKVQKIYTGKTVSFHMVSGIRPKVVGWTFGKNASPQKADNYFPTVRYAKGEGHFPVSLYAVSAKNDTASLTKENFIEVICPEEKPLILVDGFVMTSTVAQSYQWFFEGKKLEKDTARTLVALKVGKYEVETLNTLGCKNRSAPVNMRVTALESGGTDAQVLLYPNPCSDGVVRLLLPARDARQVGRLKIYDARGKVWEIVPDFVVGGKSWEAELNLSALPRGIYLLRMQIGSRVVVKKISLIAP